MPRTGKRITVFRNVYRDGPDGPYEVRVMVGGQTYTARMPPDSTDNELKGKRAELEGHGRTESPRRSRWTLEADAIRYLALIQHLATWKDRAHHLTAWTDLYGDVPRHRITEADVLRARDRWRAQAKTLAPKTINDRLDTLRNLYHRLDGKRAPTPCDDITPLRTPKTVIRRVSDADILAVDLALQDNERQPLRHFDGAKTRARFRVFVSTGKRPCEIMRAQPGDVNLKARVWVPRDAKGGYCPGCYLNDDQLAAWKLFITAKAWGPYNHGSFARTIRAAGWPQDVRPYQARHSMWIAASERGVDLADIATGAGHKDSRLTRRTYVPVLNSRLQRMSETMDGRFQKWPTFMAPNSGTAKSGRKSRAG